MCIRDSPNTTWDAVVTFFVVDGNNTPVSNVVVTGTWNTTKPSFTTTCTTDSTGSCGVDDGWTDQFSAKGSIPAPPTVTFTLTAGTGLSRSGYTYTSGSNTPACGCGSVSAP